MVSFGKKPNMVTESLIDIRFPEEEFRRYYNQSNALSLVNGPVTGTLFWLTLFLFAVEGGLFIYCYLTDKAVFLLVIVGILFLVSLGYYAFAFIRTLKYRKQVFQYIKRLREIRSLKLEIHERYFSYLQDETEKQYAWQTLRQINVEPDRVEFSFGEDRFIFFRKSMEEAAFELLTTRLREKLGSGDKEEAGPES